MYVHVSDVDTMTLYMYMYTGDCSLGAVVLNNSYNWQLM